MLVAVAIVISWLERPLTLILPIQIPGFKLGFANIVTLFTLYNLGKKDAAIITLLRVSLSSLLFGNPIGLIMSLSGAICSYLLATSIYRAKYFSIAGVSMASAAAHVIGQVAAASIILSTFGLIFSYLPLLLLLSIPSGLLTGYIATILLTKMSFLP